MENDPVAVEVTRHLRKGNGKIVWGVGHVSASVLAVVIAEGASLEEPGDNGCPVVVTVNCAGSEVPALERLRPHVHRHKPAVIVRIDRERLRRFGGYKPHDVYLIFSDLVYKRQRILQQDESWSSQAFDIVFEH